MIKSHRGGWQQVEVFSSMILHRKHGVCQAQSRAHKRKTDQISRPAPSQSKQPNPGWRLGKKLRIEGRSNLRSPSGLEIGFFLYYSLFFLVFFHRMGLITNGRCNGWPKKRAVGNVRMNQDNRERSDCAKVMGATWATKYPKIH